MSVIGYARIDIILFSPFSPVNDAFFFSLRLLARLKSNYQLGELVMVDDYPESIRLMAKFTVESLQVTERAKISYK